MKKLMLISLFAITQYGLTINAAAQEPPAKHIDQSDHDPLAAWNQAVQNIPKWRQLKILFLDDNQIKAIPNDLPQQLEILFLDNNQIKAIPNHLPQQLESLFLNSNQIQAFPNNLPQQLEILHLDNNQIQAFPNNLSQQLRYLSLANNKIQAIPNNLNLPQLERLDLRGNQFDNFDIERLLAQFPRLYTLNLSNNPNLDSRFIDDLKSAALAAQRNIEITADNILVTSESQDIKGAEYE